MVRPSGRQRAPRSNSRLMTARDFVRFEAGMTLLGCPSQRRYSEALDNGLTVSAVGREIGGDGFR